MDEFQVPPALNQVQNEQVANTYGYNPNTVQALEDPRLAEDANVNCVSYVFYMEGISQGREEFIEPSMVTEEYLLTLFDVVSEGQADIIAIMSDDKSASAGIQNLTHIALVDPADRDYVIQRMGNGGPIIRIRKRSMPGIRLNSGGRPLFLRRKGRHNNPGGEE